MKTIRIATRESALALWQANHVKDLLEQHHPELTCELIGMTTQGDRDKASPLSQMGGKGVFVKELELALFDQSADIAVHSMKDVPGELPEGLIIDAMVARADPRDALVSNRYACLAELPPGATIGSSSLRRVRQIEKHFPALKFSELRGNVDTRLRKLDDAHYDAIILAVAGLDRLGLSFRVAEAIDPEISLPAAGQGAVGIECRAEDLATRSLLAAINDQITFDCVSAERGVTLKLGATCNLPIAVFGRVVDAQLELKAFVSDLAGESVIREEITGPLAQGNKLSAILGDQLLAAGALDLIESSAH